MHARISAAVSCDPCEFVRSLEFLGVDSMRIWPLRLVLVLLLLAVCGCQKLNAQTTTSGALAGVVADQSNTLLPDADVEIRDNDNGTRKSTKTGRDCACRLVLRA